MELLKLTWQDVENYLKNKKSVIIPVGSVEQHSKALPLGTDCYIVEKIALETGRITDTLIAPCMRPGLSLIPHMAFPGTVSLKPETLQKTLEDTINSFYLHGFRQFLLINGNKLNDGPIASSIQTLCYSLKDIKIISRNWWELKKVRSLRKVYFTSAGHSSAEEVSLMLYIEKNLVKKEFFSKHILPYNYITDLEKIRDYASEGLIKGDQKEGDQDLGRQLFDEAVKSYINILKELTE